MSQAVNKKLIGIFVAGALAILLAAAISFGAFSFRKKTVFCVIYTTDSVNGLSVNSDVKFKGVKIGSVKEIRIPSEDPADETKFMTPVILEIDEKNVEKMFTAGTEKFSRNVGKIEIEKGLRARIQTANLFVGTLYVEIDFFPETPCIFRGNDDEIFEIPVIQSSGTQMFNAVSAILNGLAEVDYKKLGEQLSATAAKIDEILSEVEFKKIGENVTSATNSLSKILADPELEKAVGNAAKISENLVSISEKIDGSAEPLSSEIQKTLGEFNETLVVFRALLNPQNGVLNRDLFETLDQMNSASRAIRELAEFLKNNPNAVLSGVVPEEK